MMLNPSPVSQHPAYRVALHEAGHAVATLTFGRRVQSIGCTPIIGRCELDYFVDGVWGPDWGTEITEPMRTATLCNVTIKQAGNAAELLAFGNSELGLTDNVQCLNILTGLYPDRSKPRVWQRALKAAFDGCAERAKEILTERWSVVLAIAEALLSNPTCSAVWWIEEPEILAAFNAAVAPLGRPPLHIPTTPDVRIASPGVQLTRWTGFAGDPGVLVHRCQSVPAGVRVEV
jgi:hypothetical protein